MIVFLVRYHDLFMYYVSLYNEVMKIFFIFSAVAIIFLMRFRKPYSITYDSVGDGFPHLVLLPVAGLLTFFVNIGTTWHLLAFSYSHWLEALAFIPQIVMLHKMRDIENLTSHYVAMLGLYRFFYILNW